MKEQRELIGLDIVFEVGDPWDFSSHSGKNIIRGRIVDVCNSPEWGPSLVVDAHEVLSAGEVTGIYMLLVSRHVGVNILTIKDGVDAASNGRLIPGTNTNTLPSPDLISKSVRFVIGSVKLAS